MIVLPEEILETLRQNAALSRAAAERDTDHDPCPVLKLFNPIGSGTWLATEVGEDGDTLFGLADLGFGDIAVHGETILFNGGSLPARYLKLTMQELEASLLGSGLVGRTAWSEAMALFDNARFWTWQNSYVTTSARRPA